MFTRNTVLALAGLALALGTGCTGTTDFDITKTFDPVNSAGADALYVTTVNVDMAAEAGSAWKHRSKIKSLELVGLTGTLTGYRSPTTTPALGTTGSGSILIERNGSQVTVGTWSGYQFPTSPPDTIGTTLNAAAVSLIEDALRNDGRFSVVFSGSTNNEVHFAADVTLHLKLKYKVP